MRDKLQALLTRLQFDGMAAALDAELERAEREATPASEVIHRLLCAEAASQRQRSLAYRLKQARLPWDWTLDTFPFDEQASLNRGQIRTLAGLDFLSRANNIVLTGKTGTGKTGIAVGICVKRASTATAAASMMRKICSTSSTPLWRTVRLHGCSNG
jgi:DNA replication protein DnaC